MVNYQVGDVVEQRVFGGMLRLVLVKERDPDIKNGWPGFSGTEVRETGETVPNPYGLGSGVWGYDHQVVRIVRRATPDMPIPGTLTYSPNTAMILGALLSGGDVRGLARRLADQIEEQGN